MARYYSEDQATYINIQKRQVLYEYEDVPLFYWRGLLDAESKGKFINTNIKRLFKFNKR